MLANVAAFLLETTLVRKVLGQPEDLLFIYHHKKRLWPRLFPGYYHALRKETCARVLSRAAIRGGPQHPGRALFFHCHPIVKREQVTLERLNNFLNAYGFCRNVSLTALVAAGVLILPGFESVFRALPAQC